jgi:hypothetical protein
MLKAIADLIAQWFVFVLFCAALLMLLCWTYDLAYKRGNLDGQREAHKWWLGIEKDADLPETKQEEPKQ